MREAERVGFCCKLLPLCLLRTAAGDIQASPYTSLSLYKPLLIQASPSQFSDEYVSGSDDVSVGA